MNSPRDTRGVDTVITADFVLTMNAQYDLFSPGAVAVCGDRNVAVGNQ